MLPYPDWEADSESHVPDRATVPQTMKAKEWKYWDDKVLPQLKKFYCRNSRFPVVIPTADWDEMSLFIANGPSPNHPPQWINWGRCRVSPAGPVVTPDTPAEVQVPPPPSKRKWTPFMKPRTRKRKKKSPAKFPYPVGTNVAKRFGCLTYEGKTLTLTPTQTLTLTLTLTPTPFRCHRPIVPRRPHVVWGAILGRGHRGHERG